MSDVVWGTGAPLREFLYSDGLGEAAVFLMQRCIHALGWHHRVSLEEGLQRTYKAYTQSMPAACAA